METRPFLPLPVRFRAAQHRVIREYEAELGQRTAVDCFTRCIDDVRQLGLRGNALIIAAEHMASSRLRQRVASAEQRLIASV